MPELDGIDVSYAQGVIGWDAVARTPGLNLAMARIARGTTTDTRASANIPAIRARFGLRGWYQFLLPGLDPSSYATTVMRLTGGHVAGEFVFGDVEGEWDKKGRLLHGPPSVDEVARWVGAVTGAYGPHVGVYAGGGWAGWRDPRLADVLRLIPDYRPQFESPPGGAHVWQWGGDRKPGWRPGAIVDGIANNVDSNQVVDWDKLHVTAGADGFPPMGRTGRGMSATRTMTGLDLEDEMQMLVQANGDDAVWITNLIMKSWVPNPTAIAADQFLLHLADVHMVEPIDLHVYGPVVGPMPPGAARDAWGMLMG
jgi:hypothetical protein